MAGGSSSASVRRAWVAALALTMIVGIVPGSRASVSDRMRDARAQLEDLTTRIQGQAATIGGLRDQLNSVDARIDSATRTLAIIMDARRTLEVRAARAQARYRVAQTRLDEIAAQAFMNAPGATPDITMLGAAFDASSIEEFGDRMTFSSAVGAAKAAIADQFLHRRAVLDERRAALDETLTKQESTVGDLASARAEQADALAREQAALTELEQTRDQVIERLQRLRAQLTSDDYDTVARAFQGDAHVPYGRWAGLFLSSMHLPVCHENLVLVVAWQVQEFTQAAWNPLATTHRMTGSTDFNSVGVQNYVSLGQGLAATQETFDYGTDVYRYGAIVASLAACNDAMTTAEAVNASSWCYGCGNGSYLVAVVPKVAADYATYARI